MPRRKQPPGPAARIQAAARKIATAVAGLTDDELSQLVEHMTDTVEHPLSEPLTYLSLSFAGHLEDARGKLRRLTDEQRREWADICRQKAEGCSDLDIEQQLGLMPGTIAKRRWRLKNRGRRHMDT